MWSLRLSASASRSSRWRCAGIGRGRGRSCSTFRGSGNGVTSDTEARNNSASAGMTAGLRGFFIATCATGQGRRSPCLRQPAALQAFLRVERRHAAGPSAGDGLAVYVILHVAGGKHAGDAGSGGVSVQPALGDDVAVLHLELALENFGVRTV